MYIYIFISTYIYIYICLYIYIYISQVPYRRDKNLMKAILKAGLDSSVDPGNPGENDSNMNIIFCHADVQGIVLYLFFLFIICIYYLYLLFVFIIFIYYSYLLFVFIICIYYLYLLFCIYYYWYSVFI
jgi:type IV secretory pathway TrbL component